MVKARSDLVRYKEMCNELDAECTRLKAEVERLTKAGDAMAERLMYQGYPETVPAWKSAKEGKQP
jgi:hypothetical protein